MPENSGIKVGSVKHPQLLLSGGQSLQMVYICFRYHHEWHQILGLSNKLNIHMVADDCNVIMHDGAPCHRSKLLKNNSQKNFDKLDWSEVLI